MNCSSKWTKTNFLRIGNELWSRLFPFFRYNQIFVCINEQIKWTRNFQQWQKCYCSCDLSDHWTDFILDSFLKLFSGCTIIFYILWTQYQTAIFQGPLHFQYLRWLPPVSELNTCITILLVDPPHYLGILWAQDQ